MTHDDELHRQLRDAAAEFPIRGWSTDLKGRAVRRRRLLVAVTAVAGMVAVAGAGTAAALALRPDGGNPPVAATPGTGYVGSEWRLTTVTEGSRVTAVPADLGARMDLMPDGRVLLDDGVNAISGLFTLTPAGFEVRQVGSTFVGYGGNDPAQLATIAAIATLAWGSPNGDSSGDPVQDTVTVFDGNRLVIQAGGYRLTFDRTGPATDTHPDPPTTTN